MQWQSFGFREDPLNTSPVIKSTLSLFTGREQEARVCADVLTGTNVRIVIEGARGVGTTSFANFLRFTAEEKKQIFTPRTEIKVEQGWRCETLLASLISNFVREITLRDEFEKWLTDERFLAAKSLSSRISETYRAFGVDAFGFGGSYSKQAGAVTQPVVVPSPTLGDRLVDLIALVREVGYKNGALFQLNNLDIDEIHRQEDMKYLLNALRDYTQIEGSHWLFVGDVGLRKFIAQNIDRLDDIINYELQIDPLPEAELDKMIAKRVAFFRESSKVSLPIEDAVFHYLYHLTQGRLRYVFGLISRMLNKLPVADLTEKITLEIAKPMLLKLGEDRVKRSDLSDAEEHALRYLVQAQRASVTDVADKLEKTTQYTGRVLTTLVEKGLALTRRLGRDRTYVPAIHAVMAYSIDASAERVSPHEVEETDI